jgi:hypothetical protein
MLNRVPSGALSLNLDHNIPSHIYQTLLSLLLLLLLLHNETQVNLDPKAGCQPTHLPTPPFSIPNLRNVSLS